MEKARLAISRAENRPGHYLVVVNGEGFHRFVGATVAARIRGDDTFFDDSLFSIGVGGLDRVGVDGSFTLARTVSGGMLNEDWGRDEIYALVDVRGRNGAVKSNKVTGHF